MTRAAFALAVAVALTLAVGRAWDHEFAPEIAQAHLVTVPTKASRSKLENRAAQQKESLAHARYVCRHGARANQRWHCAAKVWIRREWNETMNLLRPATVPNVYESICMAFGGYCSQAIRVASCETGGTFDTGATNGQYLGLFQMGETERATYGHSASALGQAQAAYRYFVASGRDWSPWACKP